MHFHESSTYTQFTTTHSIIAQHSHKELSYTKLRIGQGLSPLSIDCSLTLPLKWKLANEFPLLFFKNRIIAPRFKYAWPPLKLLFQCSWPVAKPVKACLWVYTLHSFRGGLDSSILKKMKPQQHNSVTLIKVENHAKIMVRCHLYITRKIRNKASFPYKSYWLRILMQEN